MAETSNVGKFLDFLGAAEGAGYNTIVGGGSFSSYDKHPGIVGLRTKEGPSTAAGKYQITKTTYDDIAPKLGITDFSPASQDRIALELIKQKGALADVQSGNYDAAVSKLGGTWASLPSSPYSQPKRSSEWVSKYFGGKTSPTPYVPPTLQNQTNTGESITPATSPSQIDMALKESQNEAKYGGLGNQLSNLPEAVAMGFQTQNYVYNWLVEQNMSKVDQDFRYTKELVSEVTSGINPEYHGYILSGVSQEDVFRRRARVEESLRKQQELAQMGAVGVVGTLTGSLVDLPTLIGFVPGLGTASVVSKTNRLKNALATGLAFAGGNVAGEAVLAKYRPLATDSDLYYAAAAGLAFGLPIGALTRPGGSAAKLAGQFIDEAEALSKFGQKTVTAIQKTEIETAGLTITEKGRKTLDPEYRAQQVEKAEIEAIRQESKSIPTMENSSRYTDWVPTNSKGRAAYTPGSTKAEMEKLAKSADPAVALPAARILEQLGEDLPWYTLPKTNKAFKKGSPGTYFSDPHIVTVSKEAKDTTKVHEAAHALTWHKLQYGKANPDTAHGKLYAEFNAVYQQALDEAKKQGFSSYYLKNIEEFAAGLYGGASAKPMIEFLSKIKVEGDVSLLTKFVQNMKKMLGFDDNEMNLFLKSLDISDRLVDEALMVKTTGVGKAKDKEFLPDNADYKDYMPEGSGDNGAKVGFTSLGPALENYFARSWVPQEAREIFYKLAGSTTGYKNHAVVEQHASELAELISGSLSGRLDKSYVPSFNKYFGEMMEKGEATRWKEAEVFASWERQVGNYVRGIEGDYHPTIIKTGNDIKSLMKEAVDHINNPAKFNGGTKRGLTQIEEIDPETGAKSLSEPLPYNENYLPRHPDVAKFNSMTAQFGPETVQKFFSNSFKAANPNVDDAVAKRFGKWYFNNLQDSKLNRTNDNLENMLRGFDRDSLKESFVKHGGMTDVEADELLGKMFPKRDKANPLTKNLKSRSSLDETYSEQILMPDGSTHTMSLNDFIDTRTIDVVHAYFRRTAGSVALANRLDVYKASDIDRLIKNATEQEFGTSLSSDRLEGVREHLNFTFDRVLGRPVENFSVFNKMMEMWRSLHVSRLMGGAVYNQVQELSQIIGSMGWKTTLRAIPELRAMVRDAKTGKVANEMLDQLENLTGGAGADLLRRTDFSPRDDWVRQRGNTALNQWLDRTDNVMANSAAGVLKYTGMTGVMIQQKRIHAIAMINHFVEAANGKSKLAFSKERLAWMGLDDADTQKVLDGIKSYHQPQAGSKVGKVDFEKWQATDPETYAKFIVAYQREARRVVQENDLASMVPIMGKGWGQTMFQFMNFSMQGWNKSMAFAMNHKDYQTLSTVLHGSMFAAATYIARTNASMIGMSESERIEFAEKRLNTKQIVANSVGRIAQVSLLPMLIDSTIAPTPIFSGAKTTSNVTDFIGSNPTLSAISTALAMPRKIALASASDDVQIGEKDVRTWMRLLPFNNVVGISNVLNSIAADFPNSDKQE
jgi:muramidase (phage lysozyme)